MVKYKKTEAENWFIKINEDGKKTPSFTNKGGIGKALWSEMQENIKNNLAIIEDEFTPEELSVKQEKDNSNLLKNQNNLCIKLLNESEYQISNHPPYPEDVGGVKELREQWWAIMKSGTIQNVPPNHFKTSQ